MAVFSPDGLCEFVNPAGARILGVDAEAIIGLHVNVLAAPDRATFAAELGRCRPACASASTSSCIISGPMARPSIC